MINRELLKQQFRLLILVGTISFVAGSIFTYLITYQSRTQFYLKKYGFVPEFKAGLHGRVGVAGEMGTLQREISYMGDVLNTTSRIEGQCNKLECDFFISSEIYNSLIPIDKFHITEYKELSLRGKESKVNLYGVHR